MQGSSGPACDDEDLVVFTTSPTWNLRLTLVYPKRGTYWFIQGGGIRAKLDAETMDASRQDGVTHNRCNWFATGH